MVVSDRPAGLADRIASAAAEVVRHHARAIERNPNELRSVVVEVELKADRHQGAVVAGSETYCMWRTTSSEAAGLKRGGG